MRQMTMLSSHLSDLDIAMTVEALRGDVLLELPKHIIQHLENCIHCKCIVLEVSNINSVDTVSNNTISLRYNNITFPKKRRYRGKQMTMSFSVIILTCFLIYFVSDNSTIGQLWSRYFSPNVNESPPITLNLVSDTSAFIVSPNYEDLISSNFRGSSNDISTQTYMVKTDTVIVFYWPHLGKPVTISIISNKEDVIMRYTTKYGSFQYQERLNKGLYYWKLEDDGGILFVGKFLLH